MARQPASGGGEAQRGADVGGGEIADACPAAGAARTAAHGVAPQGKGQIPAHIHTAARQTALLGGAVPEPVPYGDVQALTARQLDGGSGAVGAGHRPADRPVPVRPHLDPQPPALRTRRDLQPLGGVAPARPVGRTGHRPRRPQPAVGRRGQHHLPPVVGVCAHGQRGGVDDGRTTGDGQCERGCPPASRRRHCHIRPPRRLSRSARVRRRAHGWRSGHGRCPEGTWKRRMS